MFDYWRVSGIYHININIVSLFPDMLLEYRNHQYVHIRYLACVYSNNSILLVPEYGYKPICGMKRTNMGIQTNQHMECGCNWDIIYPLVIFNIAMENGPFIDGDIPWLC